MRYFLTILFCVSASCFSFSQGLMDLKNNTTRQDTLRGSITLERSWWDLNYYHLDISVKPEKKYIEGSNLVYYTVLNSNNVLQIDLQEPVKLKKQQDGEELEIQKEWKCLLYHS